MMRSGEHCPQSKLVIKSYLGLFLNHIKIKIVQASLKFCKTSLNNVTDKNVSDSLQKRVHEEERHLNELKEKYPEEFI